MMSYHSPDSDPNQLECKIHLVLAWYDLWIGAYWDRRERCLYLLPIPCVGVSVKFGKKCGGAGLRPVCREVRDGVRAHEVLDASDN